MAAMLSHAPLFAGERALDKSIDVGATQERVWQAWTTREGVCSWLAPDAVVDARVDGPFRVFFDPSAPIGERGADDMRFLALQPPHMLIFDWNAPVDWPRVRAQRTVVIVRLTAMDSGTRVSLHHVGWGDGDDWDAAYRFFDRGWDQVLARLQRRFAEGPVVWKHRSSNCRHRRASTRNAGDQCRRDARSPEAVRRVS